MRGVSMSRCMDQAGAMRGVSLISRNKDQILTLVQRDADHISFLHGPRDARSLRANEQLYR
jgi:hypothetical protein